MIGDHKQLPPFGAEKLSQLLSNPAVLRGALPVSLEFIDRPLREGIGDDLTDIIDDDSEAPFAALCAEAIRMLYVFETMTEAEVKRQAARKGSGALPIARVLDIQHRMHPAIAGLVSNCFYEGRLKTDPAAAEKFHKNPSPVRSAHGSLPDTPIVLVNMPYQQTTLNGQAYEQFPRYWNPQEVELVRHVVGCLKGAPATSGEFPSLAVLSPYARQVARISMALQDDSICQSALSTFTPVSRGGAWCTTVDAFQGNEADAVIISFVRNNHHSTLRKALGFLSDPRRMNVLLSRAKWRLVIVASLEFLQTVTTPLGISSFPEASFLQRFLQTLDALRKDGAASVVESAKLTGRAR